jgi:hypothetical protein
LGEYHNTAPIIIAFKDNRLEILEYIAPATKFKMTKVPKMTEIMKFYQLKNGWREAPQ